MSTTIATTIATNPATVSAADVSTVSMTTAVTTAPVKVDWGGVELKNDMDPPTASATTIASVASTTSESVLVAGTLPSLANQFSPSSHGIGRVDGRVGRIPVHCNSACTPGQGERSEEITRQIMCCAEPMAGSPLARLAAKLRISAISHHYCKVPSNCGMEAMHFRSII
ncbi:hypothetical protein ACHAW5_000950 [Stephanodiscus triporus]|uniref:Uncharacterized protein n=1 Tax=Stephanodiscus triporus TaxID=2934178 RepID=A0ABD3N7T1_9STRA